MWDLVLAILVAGICVGAFKAGYYLWDKHRLIARMCFAVGVVFAIIIGFAVVLAIVQIFTS